MGLGDLVRTGGVCLLRPVASGIAVQMTEQVGAGFAGHAGASFFQRFTGLGRYQFVWHYIAIMQLFRSGDKIYCPRVPMSGPASSPCSSSFGLGAGVRSADVIVRWRHGAVRCYGLPVAASSCALARHGAREGQLGAPAHSKGGYAGRHLSFHPYPETLITFGRYVAPASACRFCNGAVTSDVSRTWHSGTSSVQPPPFFGKHHG